jgi:hypothetical protein
MRGFSLFTPLVGTALVITAIMISTVMMQNDVRTARGLSSSYELMAQSLSARMIRASAEVQIVNNIKIGFSRFLNETNRHTNVCQDYTGCLKKETERFTLPAGALRTESSGPIGAMYDGIVMSIEVATDYIPFRCDSVDAVAKGLAPPDCFIENTFGTNVSNMATSNPETVTTQWCDFDGTVCGNDLDATKYTFKLQINPDEWTPEIFAIPFLTKDGENKISISIIPFNFSYRTKKPIGEFIRKTIDAYSYDMGAPCAAQSSLAGSLDFLYATAQFDTSGNRSLSVTWKTDSPAYNFTLAFTTNSAFSSTTKYTLSNVPSIVPSENCP